MICPKCGYETNDRRMCTHCGALLVSDEEASTSIAIERMKRSWAEDEARSRELKAAAATVRVTTKENWAPVLSFLLPGLGQTYLGNKWGPIISICYAGLVGWLFGSISAMSSGVWFPAVAMLVIWLVSVYTAFPRD